MENWKYLKTKFPCYYPKYQETLSTYAISSVIDSTYCPNESKELKYIAYKLKISHQTKHELI